MFDHYRRDRGALLALGLVLGAIVLLAVVSAFTDSLGEQARQPLAPIENSRDFVLFGDGAAQWVMAGFSIIATCVSYYAVRLVRATFRETKRTADAAFEANELTRRQTDAFIYVSEALCVTRPLKQKSAQHLRFIVNLRNAGQFPAFIERRGILQFTDDGRRAVGMHLSRDGVVELPPGGTLPPLEHILPKEVDATLCAVVTFRTLTGARREQHFWMKKGMSLPNGVWTVRTLPEPGWAADSLSQLDLSDQYE